MSSGIDLVREEEEIAVDREEEVSFFFSTGPEGHLELLNNRVAGKSLEGLQHGPSVLTAAI